MIKNFSKYIKETIDNNGYFIPQQIFKLFKYDLNKIDDYLNKNVVDQVVRFTDKQGKIRQFRVNKCFVMRWPWGIILSRNEKDNGVISKIMRGIEVNMDNEKTSHSVAITKPIKIIEIDKTLDPYDEEDWDINETIDNEGAFLVNDIYLKNNKDIELTVLDIENILKNKLFRVENENGIPMYGPKYSLFSIVYHIKTKTNKTFFEFECVDNRKFFVYLSDTIRWKDKVFNENDPYDEEDWNINENKVFETFVMPKIFYQITPDKNIPDIIENGLQIKYSKQHKRREGIYLTDDEFTALNYENMYDEPCTLLEIDSSYLDPKHFGPDDYELQDFLDQDPKLRKKYGDDWRWIHWENSLKICNQVMYHDDIPKEAIKIVKENKVNENFEEDDTMIINTLELRKELGETNFPNDDYENFFFTKKISDKFLEIMKHHLIGNKISFTGYYYHYNDAEKSYKCEDLTVNKVDLNLANVLVITSNQWGILWDSKIVGGAVDERYPIIVKPRKRRITELDPYGEEEWDD